MLPFPPNKKMSAKMPQNPNAHLLHKKLKIELIVKKIRL